MTDDFTEDQGLDIIRAAFAPLRCVAESTDYGYFRFRVFNKRDDGILRAPKLSRNDVTSRRALGQILSQARRQIKGQGYALNPWSMPNGQAGTT